MGIETSSLPELKSLLKELKKMQDMHKKLGKRGVKLFTNKHAGKNVYLVEYAPLSDISYVQKKALEVYATVFTCKPEVSDITFVAKEALVGGMKVYCNDNAIDLTFNKVEKLLRK